MANNNSIISHKPRAPMVILRQEYLDIITARLDEIETTYSGKQINCAAKLLAVFEYWTNWKLDQEEIATLESETTAEQPYIAELDPAGAGCGPWIWKAIESTVNPELDLIHDLFNEHRRTAICRALNLLIALDYIRVRQNPLCGYDHIKQYSLHYARVQTAINQLPTNREKSQSEPRKIADQTAKNRGANR